MSAVDKRLFYLMLSPAEGQDFANEIGFSSPSEEVQEAETLEVISRWALITATGLLEDIIETSDWLCELQETGEVDDFQKEAFHKTLVSYGVALSNKLLDSGRVMLVVEGDEDE